MKRILSAAAITGLVMAASPALSDDTGTMGLMPSGEWAKAMPDKELAETRGGFFSLAFSAMLTVYAENGASGPSGNIVVGGSGSGAGLPPSTQMGVQNGQFQVSAFVGNIQNVAGILSIVQVPGSYNVVNTQLTVQISIINVLNQAQIPSITNLLLTR